MAIARAEDSAVLIEEFSENSANKKTQSKCKEATRLPATFIKELSENPADKNKQWDAECEKLAHSKKTNANTIKEYDQMLLQANKLLASCVDITPAKGDEVWLYRCDGDVPVRTNKIDWNIAIDLTEKSLSSINLRIHYNPVDNSTTRYGTQFECFTPESSDKLLSDILEKICRVQSKKTLSFMLSKELDTDFYICTLLDPARLIEYDRINSETNRAELFEIVDAFRALSFFNQEYPQRRNIPEAKQESFREKTKEFQVREEEMLAEIVGEYAACDLSARLKF